MKGKNISGEYDFAKVLNQLATGFNGMMFESESERVSRKTGHTKSKDWTVDTCYALDSGVYETGISCKWIDNGEWVIVDEYETKEESVIGHKKWVKHIKTKPKKLWSIQLEEWET